MWLEQANQRTSLFSERSVPLSAGKEAVGGGGTWSSLFLEGLDGEYPAWRVKPGCSPG